MPPEEPKVPTDNPDRQGDVSVAEKPRTEKARRFRVLLHNDDYTTREFVVLVLMKFFGRSEAEATHIMLTVHYKGRGVAGVYTRDIAESKVDQVHRFAETSGFPLRLSSEPED